MGGVSSIEPKTSCLQTGVEKTSVVLVAKTIEMCSSASRVLPLRKSCEVSSESPGRPYGVGPKPDGASQESEMDAAWQELMAITELQEFDASADAAFDPPQYQTTAPIRHYGMPAETGSCDVNNFRCYTEEGAVHQHIAQPQYGHSELHINQKVPSPHCAQPLFAVRDPVATEEGRGQRERTQSLYRHMLWTHGQPSHCCLTTDLESDSGLSVGSSPLASPDTLS
uniref:Uncharacterized protein n=1 Tax=Knipowitschia caucasica TaxID=637954 RepID=A0AAV2LYU8_KNICA